MSEAAIATPKTEAKVFMAMPTRNLIFEVVHDQWQTIPRGTKGDEKFWNGPENVMRLVDAGCLAPVSS